MGLFRLFFKYDLRVLKMQNAMKRWDESNQVEFVPKVYTSLLLTFTLAQVNQVKNMMYIMQMD